MKGKSIEVISKANPKNFAVHLMTQNENIRLGKQLVNMKPQVNTKVPDSFQRKFKTMQQREAILNKIKLMQTETERLQKQLDEQALVENINRMRVHYFDQANDTDRRSGRHDSEGGAVPALGGFDNRQPEDGMREFMLLAQKLATAQAQLNSTELDGYRMSKPERERRRLINTENGILLSKMLAILNRGKKDPSSKSPFRSKDLDPRQAEGENTTDRSEERMFQSQQVINETPDFLAVKKQSNATDAQYYETKKPKGTLNLSSRKNQIRRINEENQHLLKALKDAKPTFSVADWQQQFQRHTKLRRQIQLLPEKCNAPTNPSIDKSAYSSGFEDIRLNLKNNLRGKSQDGARSKFFIHRAKIKNPDHPRSGSFGSDPTNFVLSDHQQEWPGYDTQPVSFTRTKSVGMRGPFGKKVKQPLFMQQTTAVQQRLPKTSYGSRPTHGREQQQQFQAEPDMLQLPSNRDHNGEERRVKTTEGFRAKPNPNIQIILSSHEPVNRVEFDSPAEQPLFTRMPDDQDSLEYWRAQLRQMNGGANEWRKAPEVHMMPPRLADPILSKPQFAIQKNSFFDYGGLDYDIALSYLPEQKAMTQELTQMSQHEASIISRLTSQVQPQDRVSSKKRIMMIYAVKNNPRSGERTLKLTKKLAQNQPARFQSPGRQQDSLASKIAERRQQLNNTAQLAQLKKMSVENTTRNLSLYESNEKVIGWDGERPSERQQHKREGSDPQWQYPIEEHFPIPTERLTTRQGGRQGRTTNGQLITGEFGDDIPTLTIVNNVDFKSLTKQNKGPQAAKPNLVPLKEPMPERKKAQVTQKLATMFKKSAENNQIELHRRGEKEVPRPRAQEPEKFIKKPHKVQRASQHKEEPSGVQIGDPKDQSTRNYTRSQGSQRDKTNLIERNIKVARNKTNVATEQSVEGVKSSQTELRMNTDKVPSGVLNCDPINLEIANGVNVKQPPTDDDENEILIGDSTVEVVNSRDFEVHADKQSYHSAITSGVQAIGPPSMLSGVQNLQVEDQDRSVGAESAEYQLDSDDERLLAEDPNKPEEDSEVEIMSVEDSYSSDDANLAQIKKKDTVKTVTQQVARAVEDESDYSQEPFETEGNGSALRN